jgi:hypothetical protein
VENLPVHNSGQTEMSDPAGIIIHYGRQLKIVEDRLRMISVVSFGGEKTQYKTACVCFKQGAFYCKTPKT